MSVCFALLINYTCKMFIILFTGVLDPSTGVKLIKLFSLLLTIWVNKLDCLSLASLYSLVGKIFVGKTGGHIHNNLFYSNS